MPRNVRCALIQASNAVSTDRPLAQIRKAMIDKHLKLIEQAARKKAKSSALQELFYGPYFCAEQERALVRTDRTRAGRADRSTHAEDRCEAQDGDRGSGLRRAHARRVLQHGCSDRRDGRVPRQISASIHIPHCHPGFWEKFYFTPGDLGYPVFETKYARSASTYATTATFPRARAVLGLNGAEIVFNPSATVAGLSEYLWELEQPAHAVANGYFVGAINRVGTEKPWSIGEFYGEELFLQSAR